MPLPNEPAIRADVERWLFDAIVAKDEARPRSKQVRLGFSDLGACRELIRAKVTNEYAVHGSSVGTIKWAAFVGTAVGGMVESAVAAHGGARTQELVTCTLPSGIEVSGDVDILRSRKHVIDLKGKAGLEDIDKQIKDGSPREYLIQISGYLVGLHQMGKVDDDAIGSLVYYDRSGKSTQVATDSVTLEQAQQWLEYADERLTEIMHAIDAGVERDYLRDQEESKCWYFDCPMYQRCYGTGYLSEDEITDPNIAAAMADYDRGREMEKAAKQLKDRAKQDLGGFLPEPDPDDPTAPRPVRGVRRTPLEDGRVREEVLNWKLVPGRDGLQLRQIDLRVRTVKPRKEKAGA